MVCILSVKTYRMTDEIRPCTNCGLCETMTLSPHIVDVIAEACVRTKYQRPGVKFCGQKKNQQRVVELEREIKEMEWRLKEKKFALNKMNRV